MVYGCRDTRSELTYVKYSIDCIRSMYCNQMGRKLTYLSTVVLGTPCSTCKWSKPYIINVLYVSFYKTII
jgi:hypothetical protein